MTDLLLGAGVLVLVVYMLWRALTDTMREDELPAGTGRRWWPWHELTDLARGRSRWPDPVPDEPEDDE